MIAVLFVCTGNICRSPSAHGVFLAMLEAEGLLENFHVDSAGTHGYHIGDPPDPRSSETAMRRGYDLSPLRARKLTASDFEEYDYILAMDGGHYNIMRASCDTEHHPKIHMFLDFAPDFKETDVPDPYYGGDQGFERVLDMVESASKGLLQHIQQTHLQTN